MWIDALLAYAHYTAAFLLFAFLTVEIFLLRLAAGAEIVRLLVRADRWYLGCLAAGAATGLARLAWGVRGAALHLGAWPLYVKLALFVAVAIFAARFTLALAGWSRRAAREPGWRSSEAERARLRRWLMIEIHLAAAIPLFAVMMARAIGA